MTGDLASESLRDLRISVTTLGDLLLAAADRHPDRDAVVFPESRVRYRELAGRALRRARGLRAVGVRPGDKVGLLLPDSPDFAVTLFGIALAGGTVVPIDTRSPPGELGQVVANADLVTLVTTDRRAEHVDCVERLAEALPGLADADDPYSLELEAAPALRNVVVLGQAAPPGCVGQAALEDLAGRVPEDEVHRARLSVRVRDIAVLAYSTGATAGPRGCLLTHEALVRNAVALGRHRYRLRPEDRYWSPLPLSEVAAVLALAAVLDAGGAYVAMASFDAGKALQLLQRERVTVADLRSAAILAELTRHPGFAASDLSQVRLVNSSLPLPAPGADARPSAAPQAMQLGIFGMTQTAGIIATSRLDDMPPQRRSRLGAPLPGVDVRIADPETGENLPAGQDGEMLVRGYSLFEGYYKDPDGTARALDAGGWYHTGEIASLDADGALLLPGRRRE